MSAKNTLFRSKETLERREVVELLHQLADSLERDELVLRQGEQSTRLQVPKTVALQIKAASQDKRENTKHAVSLKLSWREGEEPQGEVSIG